MKQYENLVLSPQMNNGKIIDGLGYEITKGMFGKDKKTSVMTAKLGQK